MFLLIFVFTGLNSFFNSLSVAFGRDYPRTSFLFSSSDLFADYFKVVFSYPHSFAFDFRAVSPNISNLLKTYAEINSYKGVDGLAVGALTHFHMPPFTTLVSLLSLKLMQYIAPIWLYFVSLLSLFICNYLIINKVAIQKSDKVLWALSLLICYPVLFMITRGNIFAGIASTAIVGCLVLMQNKKIYLALLLLAVAVNIRPNAIVFIFAILMSKSKLKFKDILYFIGVVGAIFVSALWMSNLIYSDYTIDHFLSALKIYHSVYVIGDGGLAYGSSLFGSLKQMFGAHAVAELSAAFIAGVLLLLGIWLKIGNKISNSIFAFIISSCYALGSSVFGDYHLGVFVAPLFLYFLESRDRLAVDEKNIDSCELIFIYSGSLLMLVPKNYIFDHGISLQVVLNPLILLLLSILIIYYYGFYKNRIKLAITTVI